MSSILLITALILLRLRIFVLISIYLLREDLEDIFYMGEVQLVGILN